MLCVDCWFALICSTVDYFLAGEATLISLLEEFVINLNDGGVLPVIAVRSFHQ